MLEKPIIVVGGSAYADIDVLACVAAYKQYLQLQGHVACGVITGPWNQTIPSSIKLWTIDVEKELTYPKNSCRYIMVDFSDPKYVDDFVDLDSVIEVFDHHYGYEDYWHEKIGDNAKIEKIGACATLIWEKFKTTKIEDKISTVNANLLYTAIMANTLDFRSKVTHERDIIAAKELLAFTQLPKNWKEIYYAEIEEQFLRNSLKNILDDTKNIRIFETPFNFGQIELSNAGDFIQKSAKTLKSLGSLQNDNKLEPWLVNIVSIEEDCSYIYCNSAALRDMTKTITAANNLTDIANYGNNLLVTKRLWLRKELLKEMLILQKEQVHCYNNLSP